MMTNKNMSAAQKRRWQGPEREKLMANIKALCHSRRKGMRSLKDSHKPKYIRRFRKAIAKLLQELRLARAGWIRCAHTEPLKTIYISRAEGLNTAIAGLRQFCRDNL